MARDAIERLDRCRRRSSPALKKILHKVPNLGLAAVGIDQKRRISAK